MYQKDSETYVHKKAKEVLKEWLIKTNYTLDPVYARPNREEGVFFEYPICVRDDKYLGWDENWDELQCMECKTDVMGADIIQAQYWEEMDGDGFLKDPTYYLQNHGKRYIEYALDCDCGQYDEYVPTYEECIQKYKAIPLAIIDVVVPHKGRPDIGIEIKYKHKTTCEKIEKLRKAGVRKLIEVDAMWILNQKTIPTKLKYVDLI